MRRGKGNIRAQKRRYRKRQKYTHCYFKQDDNHSGGLLHECKFCHKYYCSNHTLPENHECFGLKKYKNMVKDVGFAGIYRQPSIEKSEHKRYGLKSQIERHHEQHRKIDLHKLKRLFRGRMLILILGIVAFVFSYIASYYSSVELFGWINTILWLVFAFYLYSGAFHYTNSLDMSNDLAMWVSRIIGGVIAFFGLYFGFALLVANSLFMGGTNALSVGIAIIFLGLGLLGIFMLFRTKRRYPHLYVNR
ncbi:MAG: hypothetical protein PHU12_00915 [Candidatus Aenigmarchaeota archaeon]|nr:hypothetical protein [Candidatus Aenigmarchaeota archaeon]